MIENLNWYSIVFAAACGGLMALFLLAWHICGGDALIHPVECLWRDLIGGMAVLWALGCGGVCAEWQKKKPATRTLLSDLFGIVYVLKYVVGYLVVFYISVDVLFLMRLVLFLSLMGYVGVFCCGKITTRSLLILVFLWALNLAVFKPHPGQHYFHLAIPDKVERTR